MKNCTLRKAFHGKVVKKGQARHNQAKIAVASLYHMRCTVTWNSETRSAAKLGAFQEMTDNFYCGRIAD